MLFTKISSSIRRFQEASQRDILSQLASFLFFFQEPWDLPHISLIPSSNNSWQRCDADFGYWEDTGWKEIHLLKSCATSSTGLLDPDGVAPKEGEKWRSKQEGSSPNQYQNTSTRRISPGEQKEVFSHHSPVKLTSGSDLRSSLFWKLRAGRESSSWSIPRSTFASFTAQHSFSQEKCCIPLKEASETIVVYFGRALARSCKINLSYLLWNGWESCKVFLLANCTPDPLSSPPPGQPFSDFAEKQQKPGEKFQRAGILACRISQSPSTKLTRMLRREPRNGQANSLGFRGSPLDPRRSVGRSQARQNARWFQIRFSTSPQRLTPKEKNQTKPRDWGETLFRTRSEDLEGGGGEPGSWSRNTDTDTPTDTYSS